MTQTTERPSTRPSETGTQPTAGSDRLTTQEGKIHVAQGVVQKIAGMACREVAGVYSMGTGSTRAFAAIRERIPGSSGPNVSQGVGVEVGETQAAVDLDIVVDYGASIAELGHSVQRNVKQSVERMTGLEVVEVNVNVDDVHLPDDEQSTPARVS
ncbi:putative alkaline shock family protein YloU [Hamadaea flava]|uniref:Asp23/Gls24 family envelope stress response protein n=1 Tax=Hamadaea flava TaxID=1742688 RepID=A0ABV8LNA2_9ACTN|nr:Asp23/Gls24 family envelope stress response protein [Hamadaea flava]MCP2322938.1 putative alkaline shock family protein YloU [Hamadaea flava]